MNQFSDTLPFPFLMRGWNVQVRDLWWTTNTNSGYIFNGFIFVLQAAVDDTSQSLDANSLTSALDLPNSLDQSSLDLPTSTNDAWVYLQSGQTTTADVTSVPMLGQSTAQNITQVILSHSLELSLLYIVIHCYTLLCITTYTALVSLLTRHHSIIILYQLYIWMHIFLPLIWCKFILGKWKQLSLNFDYYCVPEFILIIYFW